jgi:N4-(beta-N-acetylglucosaminyl)-L-asparaginase
MPNRREFLKDATGAGLGAAALGALPLGQLSGAPFVRRAAAARPVVIASVNGIRAVNKAAEVLSEGGDTLDAVICGVNIVEEDPADYTVGYGGLPDADGVVQLDAAVMHGPTRGAGAVGALEGVKTPSRVAVAVMQYTDHIMLVGKGAQEFARQMGFKIYDTLLTEESRRRWVEWRAKLGAGDDYLTTQESGEKVSGYAPAAYWDSTATGGAAPSHGGPSPIDSFDGVRPHGTINCNAVDANGDISGVTTTSGLFFKIPGRVGDSPIIGAGVYVDNDVGAAGSTGRGEANIKVCGGHSVVENMRAGMSPTDACLDVCRRVVHWTVEKRLLGPDGRPNFDITFYGVNKKGEFGAASLYPGFKFAVNVEGKGEMRDAAYLLKRA